MRRQQQQQQQQQQQHCAFHFRYDDDGTIVHTMTGLVLDVEGASECGALLVLKEKGCGDCQQWELIDQCPV